MSCWPTDWAGAETGRCVAADNAAYNLFTYPMKSAHGIYACRVVRMRERIDGLFVTD